MAPHPRWGWRPGDFTVTGPPNSKAAGDGEFDPDQLGDDFDAIMVDVTEPVVRATMKSFGQRVFDAVSFEADFDVTDPAVAGYVDTFGASRIKDLIGSTTRDDLAESLAEGYGAGETTLQIVKRIMAVFLQADRHRAQMIAETEITIASGVAAQAGMEMAGVEYKQWLATLDSHTRDTHREMNGQIKAVNEDFESPSGATGAGPGQFEDPAEDIFCRCAAIPIPVEALDQARADAAADQAATVKKTVKRKGHLRRLYAGEVAARQPHVDRMLEAVREGFQRQRDYVIVQLRR